jgi:hypothetical protein
LETNVSHVHLAFDTVLELTLMPSKATPTDSHVRPVIDMTPHRIREALMPCQATGNLLFRPKQVPADCHTNFVLRHCRRLGITIRSDDTDNDCEINMK